MMKNIVIFGTGAVAAELTSYLEDGCWGRDSGYSIKGYLASDENGDKNWKHYGLKQPFLGSLDNYDCQRNDYFVVAVGNSKVKRNIAECIKSKGGNFISLIHPTAIIAASAIIGEGNIIYPSCVIGPNVKINDFNLFTSQSAISHDTVIGSYNFFATALLCGYNNVGDDNYFGIKVTTLPEIHVGSRNIIQAGMIIDRSIQDDSTLFYRYKEKILAIPKTEE